MSIGGSAERSSYRLTSRSQVQSPPTRSRPTPARVHLNLCRGVHVRDRRFIIVTSTHCAYSDEAVHLTRSRVPSLHRQRNSQAATGGVVPKRMTSARELSPGASSMMGRTTNASVAAFSERVVRMMTGRPVRSMAFDAPLPPTSGYA